MWDTKLYITVGILFYKYIDIIKFIFREIASRNPHSFSTDVWSLGILIATLLTGHPPFDTDSMLRKKKTLLSLLIDMIFL